MSFLVFSEIQRIPLEILIDSKAHFLKLALNPISKK